MTYVLVIWEDAHVSTRATPKEIQEMKPVLTHSVGHLLGRSKEGIIIMMDYYPDDSDTEYREVHFIPSLMIKKVKVLK